MDRRLWRRIHQDDSEVITLCGHRVLRMTARPFLDASFNSLTWKHYPFSMQSLYGTVVEASYALGYAWVNVCPIRRKDAEKGGDLALRSGTVSVKTVDVFVRRRQPGGGDQMLQLSFLVKNFPGLSSAD